MSALKLFCLAVSIGYVTSEGELLHPCKTNDISCLRSATQKFLEHTSKGIPNYDILPIDPLIIPELELEVNENGGAVIKLTNIQITGLKNQDISDFRMDTKEKSVLLATGAQIEINSDIALDLKSPKKVYKGKYTIKANVLGNSTYNYELKQGSDGTEHFYVGPETIVGLVDGKSETKLKFDEESLKDAEFNAQAQKWSGKKEKMHSLVIRKIVERAYISVIHNIRAAAKVLPKGAFFIDV